jgi:cytochrome c553
MKTLQMTARYFTAISLLGLMVAASAHGQVSATLKANVPFAFEAGSKSLPAGAYEFKVSLANKQVLVSGAEGGGVYMRIITPLTGFSVFSEAGLVFNSIGDKHVLAEIWLPDHKGVEVSTTGEEHTRTMIALMTGGGGNLSGKEIFEHTCAQCHGPNGQGNPAADKFFNTPVPKLSSAYVQSKSDEELKGIITHGRGHMQPVQIKQASVQHLLDAKSVDAVIEFVRTLKKP